MESGRCIIWYCKLLFLFVFFVSWHAQTRVLSESVDSPCRDSADAPISLNIQNCSKCRRDKIGITRHIIRHQVLCNVHVTLESLGNCTIYSTWCLTICPILSLLLFIQSLYSLYLLVSCPFFAVLSNNK